MKELNEGLEYYPVHGLVNKNIDYVVGSDLKESYDELNKTLDISDNEVEMNLVRAIAEAQSKLSPEGKVKFGALYKQLLRSHIDEFREIIRQDEEKKRRLLKMNNVKKCDSCNLDLISEESKNHECLKVTDHWVIDGQLWIGDGIRYYPLQPKGNTTHNNRRGNSTFQKYHNIKCNQE